ncbi:TetR family transcriptional regulator [Nocardioides sp. WS12]|uniref:TetR/AcrR family transcriptional regulator n=1 Tax=Nocardioides sp. WS12 TaxID=2486272 RepID=UPI0015F8798C|nr:TetR family transcriptional regulator [Nocardioides sp. WS12]
MSETAPATRILRAAEELIAERGPSASLEDVARTAGLRNKSAVHYYFGGRDGLIAAAVNARLGEMEAARVQMLADAESSGTHHDIRSLVAMLVLPMVQIVDSPDATHFARFLDRVRDHPAVFDPDVLADERHPSLRIVMGRMSRQITMVPESDRRFRTDAMAICLLSLVAEYERTADSLDEVARERRRQELIDVLTGLVTAAPAHEQAKIKG